MIDYRIGNMQDMLQKNKAMNGTKNHVMAAAKERCS
jgi:hypothetical protein